MEVLIVTSLITAFIAGLAALFAPCCISVLLPSYLGSIFKQKRKIMLMTFVFFLGLATVFLPLGLGVAALGQVFKEYHNVIYLIGASLLLYFGAVLLLGYHLSLKPFSAPGVKVTGSGSVYVLGIFSGFATLCCAPVLAGALTLSLLPGSLFWGGVYSLVYVSGMVAPLFAIAYFLDRINFTERFMVLKKRISYSVLGRKVQVSVSELVSGAIFLLMSILIFYLALTNRLSSDSSVQVSTNIYLANLDSLVTRLIAGIPEGVLLFVLAAALSLGALLALRRIFRKNKRKE